MLILIVGSGILSALDSWFMSKRKGFGEESGDVPVSKEFFDSLNKGDRVSLVYTYGRIYDGLNIKEIKNV